MLRVFDWTHVSGNESGSLLSKARLCCMLTIEISYRQLADNAKPLRFNLKTHNAHAFVAACVFVVKDLNVYMVVQGWCEFFRFLGII